MKFNPKEIIFFPLTSCNLSCQHCITVQNNKKLPVKPAIDFLRGCADSGIERISFSGGEPFLYPSFLYKVSQLAVDKNLVFGRIMTNGVWFKDSSDLKKVLTRLYDSGYDGSICLSVDSLHQQTIAKLATFIRIATQIWNRGDLISIAYVLGVKDKETKAKLSNLAKKLNAKMLKFTNEHSCIKSDDLFIKLTKIDLSAIGIAGQLKQAWDGVWFKEDYCQGPGNVLVVMADGEVKPCCGYANEKARLTIGNIKKDSYSKIMANAKNNNFVNTVFSKGLSRLRISLEKVGVSLPGKTSNNCYFCYYVLNDLPKGALEKALKLQRKL